MEYLLAQSNRGDLLRQQVGDIDDEANDGILPDIFNEDLEDECPDLTVPQAHDLTLQVILCQQYIRHQNNIGELINSSFLMKNRHKKPLKDKCILLLITSGNWKRWPQAQVSSPVPI